MGVYRLRFATNWTATQLEGEPTRSSTLGTILPAGVMNASLPTIRLLEATNVIRVGMGDVDGIYYSERNAWYSLTPPGLTWPQAQAFARDKNGNLATVTDAAMNIWLTTNFFQGSGFWIGLSRASCCMPAATCGWQWASGAPFGSYYNWGAGQPDCAGGNELYVHVYLSTGQWNDHRPDFTLPGVVEILGGITSRLVEPVVLNRYLWRGHSLVSGVVRKSATNSSSVFYSFADDLNANGVVDLGDDFVTAEYLVSDTNATLLTLFRQPIAALAPAQSYGLASVNLLGGSNEVFFTGEPDGQVFAWAATGATNPLQRQLFSAHHAGRGWHALAGVKTLEAGEALIGLRVDPASPQRCDVILWPPQPQLPALANLPNTPPAAAVLPSAGTLGGQAAVTVRLWDAEGNAATPFLQFQISGTTNWQNATLTGLNGGAYSIATRVAASPAGQNHTVVWNALADLGANTVTNVLLRARARDMTSLGDWSVGTPFQVNTVFPGNVGNEPAFGPAQRLADGRFQLSVTGGQSGHSYVLLASTNLADWIPIHGYVFTNPPVTIIDPDAASFRWRFYRIGPPVSRPAGTLAVGNAPWSGGSGAGLLLYVTPGVHYQIEASTDLVHWSALTNFMGTVSPFPFYDPAATNFDRRFYRARPAGE